MSQKKFFDSYKRQKFSFFRKIFKVNNLYKCTEKIYSFSFIGIFYFPRRELTNIDYFPLRTNEFHFLVSDFNDLSPIQHNLTN